MKRLIMASITAVVVIAVLAGTLIPVLDDATATTDTFTNDGYRNYSELDDTESYTMVWDPDTHTVVTVNGEDIALWTTGDGARSYSIIMIPDVGIIRYTVTAAGAFVAMQAVGLGDISLSTGFTLTIEEGTYTLTNAADTPVTVTGTFTSAYAIDPDGDYILKNGTDSVYLHSDSTISIVAMGLTQITAWNDGFQIVGTLDDYDVEVFYPTSNTFVISDVTDDRAAVDGYEDLYTLSKITFNVTDSSDSTVDVDATYSYFLVPVEVTAERTVHFTDGENAILNAIPVMIIVALLLAVVAMVIRSRMD